MCLDPGRDHGASSLNPCHPDRRFDGPGHITAEGCCWDLAHVHLHGRDIAGPDTPYFAGFALRYFSSVPACLTEYRGTEWIDVVHPTQRLPLHALRILPSQPDLLAGARWT
jgi:hypothetical protein